MTKNTQKSSLVDLSQGPKYTSDWKTYVFNFVSSKTITFEVSVCHEKRIFYENLID